MCELEAVRKIEGSDIIVEKNRLVRKQIASDKWNISDYNKVSLKFR